MIMTKFRENILFIIFTSGRIRLPRSKIMVLSNKQIYEYFPKIG